MAKSQRIIVNSQFSTVNSQSFCAILSHYITPKTSILAENREFFTKNGFGKGFALLKSEDETEQKQQNNKQINNYNYGKDYWY